MKFLADENFPRAAVAALRESGVGVDWVTENMPGSSDEDVLACCAQEGRTLLTLDKDFGELVFRRRLPAPGGVILFRVDAATPADFADTVLSTVQSGVDWAGFFSVVSHDRIRMTPLPRQQ
jgi:predicted nuclease of predicted toxin-antitoxin system